MNGVQTIFACHNQVMQIECKWPPRPISGCFWAPERSCLSLWSNEFGKEWFILFFFEQHLFFKSAVPLSSLVSLTFATQWQGLFQNGFCKCQLSWVGLAVKLCKTSILLADCIPCELVYKLYMLFWIVHCFLEKESPVSWGLGMVWNWGSPSFICSVLALE